MTPREKMNQWFRAVILHKWLPIILFSLEKPLGIIYALQQKKLSGKIDAVAIPAEWNDGHFSKTFVMLVNGRGGGADTFTENKAKQLEARGIRVFFLHYHPLRFRLTISRYAIHSQAALRFMFPWRYAAFVQLLRYLHIEEIHVHGTRFLPFYFVRDIVAFAKNLNATLHYMAHDFISVCPRIQAFDGDYRYCGMPSEPQVCDTCIRTHGALVIGSPPDIREYRNTYATLLNTCKTIIAPSEDAASRIRRYFLHLEIGVTSHPSLSTIKPVRFPPAGARRNIGIIGAIERHKGADVLLACVKDAKERHLPLDFFVFGYTCYDATLRSLGCTITGRYKETELSGLLQQYPCPIAFLPSTWPETFCHTLTHALAAGMHPVVFDFGAPAERLRAIQRGTTLPPEFMNDASRINDALLKA